MIDNKTIYQVDAFTDKAFKGNPAGVMILDKLPSVDWMQNMAAEMNLSETAFVAPNSNGFDIRYFTPTVEIPLCGHATLASAHIIYQLGIKTPEEKIHFRALKDNLTITKDGDAVVMTFPQYSLSKIETPANFRADVGFEPVAIYKSDDNWVVAIANTQEDIEHCKPNFEALIANGLGHLMITSEGKTSNVDFVVRCFVPEAGINEDPVTGSAHCALTPLWASRLGKTKMVSHQISKRGGVLKVALADYNVKIKGNAITIFQAQLKI
ncbi:PhzF family phenazine biosynthesis protein [Jejuia pallidilutea]|uniref:PhzF family phenazine biosynthesis protein n=1 Tax=Jejuia pallidilutea TaxID=504487 RepID=A0A362WZK5_9FLAO|nr:PhzF family phenazine biosynthesis protein [Jejuia pallidilutea]PQV48315.1 PhzF family phenazine biosynthesis protein [Jejuia pallidilutea]